MPHILQQQRRVVCDIHRTGLTNRRRSCYPLAGLLVLVLVLHLLQQAPVRGATPPAQQHRSRVAGSRAAGVSDLAHLQQLLKAAEQQLLGKDSCALDVAGAVQLLLQVHVAVSKHFGTAALNLTASATDPASASSRQQGSLVKPSQQAQSPGQDSHRQSHQALSAHSSSINHAAPQPAQPAAPAATGPKAGSIGRTSKRQKRRATRLRKARLAAAWQELGRASFTLAALSASGLIAEFLPPLPHDLDAAAARASLCKQLQAAHTTTAAASAGSPDRKGGDSAGSSSRSSSADRSDSCPVAPSMDTKALQELEWLVTAAAAGTAQAQMALADRFLMGRGGLQANCSYGLPWLLKAADSVARQAELAGNWDLAPSFIRLRERHMDMTSPQSYAEWDEEQMAEELQAAAAFGSSDSYAQRRLGYRRLVGRGIEQDHHAAYKDLTAAADGGSDGFALYNLGIMYLRGLYVTRDPLQALQYFKRALERGVGAAANAIGVLAAHGEAMPTDYTAAARWFEKGANMSDPDSIYNLGSLYIHGRGVKRDAQAALSYYGMAFDLGHWKAPLALGQLYAGSQPGLGHNCEYAEKYLWQFVSQRSGWLTEAQAALQDYDGSSQPAPPASTAATTALPRSELQGSSPRPEEAGLPVSGAEVAGDVPSVASLHPPGGRGVGPAARTQQQHRVMDRHTQALVRYLLLAESGCEAAAENAAWMLLHGQGAGGPRAMGLAAHLLYRSSMLNHTSSMVELARLLLNESIITHPQHLQQALPGSPTQAQHTLALDQGTAARQPLASTSTAANASIALGPLHHVLLQHPHAFMPPIAGATACTGFYRRQLPDIMQNVSNATTSAQLPTGRSPQGIASARPPKHAGTQGSASNRVTATAAEAAGLMVWRARQAAVAWLWEANSVGDAEAAALLGWLWHEGVLQGSKAQQEALAVIKHALSLQPPAGQQAALFLVQSFIWLEQQACRALGQHFVTAARSALLSLRDGAVRLRGLHPTVLDMPDGLCHAVPSPPGSRSQGPHSNSFPAGGRFAGLFKAVAAVQAVGQLAAGKVHAVFDGSRGGEGRMGQPKAHQPGFWEAIGGDKVDKENLILTCLLGALAAVLWLHVRQQGQAARRARLQAESQQQAPAARIDRAAAAGGGGDGGGREQQEPDGGVPGGVDPGGGEPGGADRGPLGLRQRQQQAGG